MFKSIVSLRRVLTLAVLLGSLESSQAIIIEFGTGNDFVDLVVEAPAFGPEALHYRYLFTYDPANPLDGYDLAKSVEGAFTNIVFDFSNFGTADDPNYFLNAITYNSTSLTNTGAPDFSPYWAQWVSGGEAGFPTAQPVETGSWSFGSGASRPYRLLAPFASDGYIFNDGSVPPSTQPVPEPASWGVVLAAGLVLLLAQKKNRSSIT